MIVATASAVTESPGAHPAGRRQIVSGIRMADGIWAGTSFGAL
jgi:hypothetical protein